MATWLEQFAARLQDIDSTRGANLRGGGPEDAIYGILRQRIADANLNKDTFNAPTKDNGHSLGHAWEDIKSGGGRILDVLSRANYASANFKSYQTQKDRERKAKGDSDPLGLKSLTDLGGATEAAWKGLSGQSKKTYVDVLKENMGTPDEQNIGGYWNPNRDLQGVLGFAGDVALDPTTYVGAGTIKAAGKLVLGGRELPKLGRAKNVLSTEKVMLPDEKAAVELADTGTTTVKESNTQRLIDKFNVKDQLERSKAFDVVDNTPVEAPPAAKEMLQIEAPPKAKFIVDSAGTAAYKPWQQPTKRLAAEAHLKSLQAAKDRLLKGLEAKRYGADTTIDPLWRTEKTMEPEKYFEDVIETLPKKDTAEVLSEGIRKIHEGAVKGPGTSVKIFGKDGKPIPKAPKNIELPSEAEWVKLPEAKQRELMEQYAKAFRESSGGVYSSISLKTLAETVAGTGKLPDVIANAHIRVGAKLEPLQAYVNKLKEQVNDHEIFGEAETVTRQVEKTREVEKVIQRRLSPTETLAWAAKHQDILDPEDMTAIRRAVGLGPKSVETVMNKIREKVMPRDFGSIEELQAAKKGKMLTEKGNAALKYRMSQAGIRNLPEIDRKIEAAAKAARLAAEQPTKVNKAKAAKAAAVVQDATAASKTVTAKIEDDIWTTLAVAEEVASKVEKASAGDTSVFQKPRAVLHSKQAEVVTEALRKINKSQFVDPLDRAKYGFETNRGVKRTRPTPGAGKGRVHRGFNKFSQLSLGKEIISGASKLVRGTDKTLRPAAMYDTAMPMLLAAESGLRELGIPIILGKGATGLPLSIHDVLSSLPRNFVEKFYFTPETSMGITQLADIAEQFVRMGLGQLDEPSVYNNVAELLAARSDKYTSPLTSSLKSQRDIEAAADEFMASFTEAMPKITDALTTNSAAAVIKVGDETKALTDEVIQRFNEVVTNPRYSAADVMTAALGTAKQVADSAAVRDIPVSGEARVLAEQAAAAHVADTLPMASVATAAKGAEKFAKATTTSQAAKIAEQLAKSADVEAHALMKEMDVDVLDLGAAAEFGAGVEFFRAFAPHLGNELLRPILTARMSVAQSLSKQFTRQLGRVSQMHTTADLAEALRLLQEGREATTPAMQSMEQVMKELFSVGDSKYGLISRNGISADHLHSKFKHFGIGDMYRLDHKNIDESWKHWKLDDPLDFMSKFHAAVSSAVAERRLGADIGRMFGKDMPQSTGKWIKISDPGGESKLATLIDRGKFYPEDVARQMHMIDRTLSELSRPAATNKFLRTLDSALHAYKAGVTIYRPGHHVRNMIGDVWLSSMDGVKPNAYKRATAVLGTRKSQYADFDALRALDTAYAAEGVAPKSALNLTFKGKQVSLSPDEVYRLAFDNGVLPDYSVLEDVAFGTREDADKIASTLKKVSPFKGKLHRGATAASEYRDHYVRIAHFLHAMEETPLKGKTLEEALQNATHIAGNRVRKWHPDGSDLSHFEKTVARRTILFYSWVRKAIPLVVETSVMRPGRVMIYPKAMQNIAAANGIDLDGYGNPFPEDQLFPSYIADSTQGPQFGEAGAYVGIKPGIPNMDVMDDFAVSPLNTLRTIMGGTQPGLKIPAEVAGGNQLRTGTPIMDKTDYIDSQIPGANYLAKLAGGRSPSSLFTQDTRVAPSNEGYEGNPNTPGVGGTDFLNWLLGLGITDYSKPSSIKSAQREKGGR